MDNFAAYINQIPGRALIFSSTTTLCMLAMGLYEPRMREGRSGVLVRIGLPRLEFSYFYK